MRLNIQWAVYTHFWSLFLSSSHAMEKAKKISYQRGTHRGENRPLLEIPYDEAVIEKVKMIPDRNGSDRVQPAGQL